MNYNKLASHLQDNYDLILTQSELQDVVDTILSDDRKVTKEDFERYNLMPENYNATAGIFSFNGVYFSVPNVFVFEVIMKSMGFEPNF